MAPGSPLPDVRAAGAVVTRSGGEVLLVHRPKYDDWAFPKGKLDPGEHVTAAAVREVAEETGLDIRLGPPLTPQRYRVGNRMKTVEYWVGRVLGGGDDVSGFVPTEEVDKVRWVPFERTGSRLTYRIDRRTLQEALPLRKRTCALVVLRHAKARSRKAWRRDDRLRPLLQAGTWQAERVVPVLAAYGVTRLATSSSTRCVQTLTPYADVTGLKLHEYDGLSEEDATPGSVRDVIEELRAAKESSVLCGHRPVLPEVFAALGVPDPKLDAGAMLVAHLRRGAVVATEVHTV